MQVNYCSMQIHCSSNIVPQAVDESCEFYTTLTGEPITLNVIANDTIPWASDTTVRILTLPQSGALMLNADNTITYASGNGYEGHAEFTYSICLLTGSVELCDTAAICISVIDTLPPCYLPNAFSPNGDGVNDLYKIPCSVKNPKASLRIFNRWGAEVWFSNGPYLNDWDGSNKQGVPLPDGTYYVIFEYNNGTGNRYARSVAIQR